MKTGAKVLVMATSLSISGLLTLLLARATKTSWNEYAHRRHCEERILQETQILKEKLDAEEYYLNALLNDPACVERVARQRLGASGPHEFVFHFESGL